MGPQSPSTPSCDQWVMSLSAGGEMAAARQRDLLMGFVATARFPSSSLLLVAVVADLGVGRLAAKRCTNWSTSGRRCRDRWARARTSPRRGPRRTGRAHHDLLELDVGLDLGPACVSLVKRNPSLLDKSGWEPPCRGGLPGTVTCCETYGRCVMSSCALAGVRMPTQATESLPSTGHDEGTHWGYGRVGSARCCPLARETGMGS